jgi:hypothetical protein
MEVHFYISLLWVRFERSVAVDEVISIRALGSVPEWLIQSWESAKPLGLDRLSVEEIDAEIEAARRARRDGSRSGGRGAECG